MYITADSYIPTGEIEMFIIKSIWRLSEADLHRRNEIILPKGTVEIIFNFSGNTNYINPSLNQFIKLPSVFVNGINFKPFELIKTGQQDFLGIQLSAVGLRILFNLSSKEFNNRVYDGINVHSYLETLANELYGKKSFPEQVECILKWIKLKISGSTHQKYFDRLQQLFHFRNHPHLTVKKLGEYLCLSDRQLRRFTTDWLGMSSEEFILYNKYLSALVLVHDPEISLTEVGLKAGYYDQSHFIREFRSYTDMTPKGYRNASKGIPGHIFT
ncbi:MAG: helix-turn-helix transcriptional regulator [Saprospiraceae bacterium]|nr:helix-turn-helix transcriptional regulator [Saprospiraceae bacterium]